MSNLLLTKDQILQVEDLDIKDIYVKPWDGYVRIRTMTAHERDQFEQQMFSNRGGKKDKLEDVRAKLVSMTLVDEDNNRLFAEKDVKALSKKSSKALDIIFSESQKLNSMSNEEVEDMTKNSETTQDDFEGGE